MGCAHGSAPTGALPWAQRCMRVDLSPWVWRNALTGAQLNAMRLSTLLVSYVITDLNYFDFCQLAAVVVVD